MKRIIFPAIAVLLIASCGQNKETERLRLENEELVAELNRTQRGVATLEEIGVLMDSIDAARKTVQLDLETGTSYEDYTRQMQDITSYVKETENKLAALESQFSQSSQNNQAYIKSIKRLKNDLAARAKEVDALNYLVEQYKNENSDLLSMVQLQEAELEDKTIEIERKKEELNLLENRIQYLMTQAQVTEADAYFARAAAVEEAANRTKLAPRKKKETMKEALDLYKRAFALGREDAETKIKELEEKI